MLQSNLSMHSEAIQAQAGPGVTVSNKNRPVTESRKLLIVKKQK